MNEKLYLGISTGDMTPKLGARLFGYKPDGYSESLHDKLFSEIGMRIDAAVEGLKVLSLSNTNGSEGYFPTQDQLCRGGYEIGMFLRNGIQPFADDADFHIVKETLRNLY